MRKHDVKIEDHNGHEVFFFVGELDETIDADIDRHVGPESRQANNYDPVLARFAVLRRAVSGLKIDGKPYMLGSDKKAPPRLGRDPETGKKLSEHLLGYVIKYNPFLVEEDDYREHFEEYALDDEKVPASDPTRFRAVGE